MNAAPLEAVSIASIGVNNRCIFCLSIYDGHPSAVTESMPQLNPPRRINKQNKLPFGNHLALKPATRRRCRRESIILRRGSSRRNPMKAELPADFIAVVGESVSALPTNMFKAQKN
jgi:hypothetical protein